MNLKDHIPHFVEEHKKAIAVVVVILYCNHYIVMSNRISTMMVSSIVKRNLHLFLSKLVRRKRKKNIRRRSNGKD